MATIPYMSRAIVTANDAASVYPIVLYARSINKNTAEFTASDLRKFLRWLWKVYPTLNLERKWDHGRTWRTATVTSTSRNQATRNGRKRSHTGHRA